MLFSLKTLGGGYKSRAANSGASTVHNYFNLHIVPYGSGVWRPGIPFLIPASRLIYLDSVVILVL